MYSYTSVYICKYVCVYVYIQKCVHAQSRPVFLAARRMCLLQPHTATRVYIHQNIHTCVYVYMHMCLSYIYTYIGEPSILMGWLQFVGSLKLQVSFAEYRLFYRALLQNIASFIGFFCKTYICREPTNRSVVCCRHIQLHVHVYIKICICICVYINMCVYVKQPSIPGCTSYVGVAVTYSCTCMYV